jgi:hypothetical protein
MSLDEQRKIGVILGSGGGARDSEEQYRSGTPDASNR